MMDDKFTQTMDGAEWAKAFVETGKSKPGGMEKFGTDEGNMTGWFANAIMRGYDTAKNSPPDFDYMAEADKTCSVIFNPQNIDSDEFVLVLTDIASACDQLNKFKKLLVRGKTPDEVGYGMPKLHASLAVEFDPNNTAPHDIDLLHGLIGVITEAGEMAELLLARIRTGEFDRVNALEECGDVAWYIARQLRGLGIDFETMQRANIDKLHGRHGNSFDVFRDANRNLTAERERLETAAPLFEHAEDAKRYRENAGGVADETVRDIERPVDYGRALQPLPPVAGYSAGAPRDRHPHEGKVLTPNPFNVGTRKGAGTEPPGVVERLERKPIGDVEGTDC